MQHPAIQAVGFTGSRRVGRTLVALAAAREVPIPVYAEMSSINPVFLLPAALAQRAEAIAQGLIDSVTLGTGQFCTKPGIVMGIAGPDFERFQRGRAGSGGGEGRDHDAEFGHSSGVLPGGGAVGKDSGVQTPSTGGAPTAGPYEGQPMLFATSARHFLETPKLLDEVFGPAALLIECSGAEEIFAVAKHLDGQLTATMHLAEGDAGLARELLPLLERKAGRILVNGFPDWG